MCGSTRIQRQRVEVHLKNGRGCVVAAEVCRNCGERFLNRAAAGEILTAEHRKATRPKSNYKARP